MPLTLPRGPGTTVTPLPVARISRSSAGSSLPESRSASASPRQAVARAAPPAATTKRASSYTDVLKTVEELINRTRQTQQVRIPQAAESKPVPQGLRTSLIAVGFAVILIALVVVVVRLRSLLEASALPYCYVAVVVLHSLVEAFVHNSAPWEVEGVQSHPWEDVEEEGLQPCSLFSSQSFCFYQSF